MKRLQCLRYLIDTYFTGSNAALLFGLRLIRGFVKRNFIRARPNTVCSGIGIVILWNCDCGTEFKICSANYTYRFCRILYHNPIYLSIIERAPYCG